MSTPIIKNERKTKVKPYSEERIKRFIEGFDLLPMKYEFTKYLSTLLGIEVERLLEIRNAYRESQNKSSATVIEIEGRTNNEI